MAKGAEEADDIERAAPPGTPGAKKTKRGTNDDSDDGASSGAGLCEDVVGNILARLPARTAVASMALSKSHRRLIRRSPEFRSLHRRLGPPLPRPHIAYVTTAPMHGHKDKFSGFVGFHVAGAGLGSRTTPIRSLAGRRYLNLKYVNTCNGIVLLASQVFSSPCRCVLWNPAVAVVFEEVNVPDPSPGSKYLILGLGYGHRSETYKLLLIHQGKKDETRGREVSAASKFSLVTYTLGDLEKQPTATGQIIWAVHINRCCSLYMEGRIYLLVSKGNYAILAFDVDDETVTSIDPPMKSHPNGGDD